MTTTPADPREALARALRETGGSWNHYDKGASIHAAHVMAALEREGYTLAARQDEPSPALRAGLATLRERIAATVKKHPDSSHGEDYRNTGIESALKAIDLAMGAACDIRPSYSGEWCHLHGSLVDAEHSVEDGRCGGYRYVADRVIPALAANPPQTREAEGADILAASTFMGDIRHEPPPEPEHPAP